MNSKKTSLNLKLTSLTQTLTSFKLNGQLLNVNKERKLIIGQVRLLNCQFTTKTKFRLVDSIAIRSKMKLILSLMNCSRSTCSCVTVPLGDRIHVAVLLSLQQTEYLQLCYCPFCRQNTCSCVTVPLVDRISVAVLLSL